VLAELGDGLVAVGVGHAHAAGRVALGGGTHVLNATDRRARGHRPRSGDPDIHPWVESVVNPGPVVGSDEEFVQVPVDVGGEPADQPGEVALVLG